MNARILLLLAAGLAAPLVASAQQPNRFGQSAVVSPPDGVMVINGSVYKVTKGFAVVVAGNGVVRGIDGNPVSIPSGAMYTTDGRLIPIPAGISGLPVGLKVRGRQPAKVPAQLPSKTPGDGNFRRGPR
jgi:hypothetical protein